MKQRKIIIIRGKVTGGKTTTSHELAKVLPGWIFIDIWKIKEMFEPLELKDRTVLISASKKARLVIMREVIKEMGINIIVQEITRSYINKHFRKELKKHNYKIYSFFLDVELKDAVKRDIRRKKPTMGLGRKIKDEKVWKSTKGVPEKGDIIINTSKHKPKEVVNMILKEIGEKRKKHPKAHWIRKVW